MIVLRHDQIALTEAIRAQWAAGQRNVLGVLPTGGGKSVIVSGLSKTFNDAGYIQCVMAHRVELVGQMSGHIARREIPHRIIAPKNVVTDIMNEHKREFGRSWVNPSARCTVAGVDTLMSRIEDLRPWALQVGAWTIDEGHHLLRENKWGKAAALFPNAFGLGVTATPQRADGKGLGRHADGVYDAMVLGPSMRELIDAGSLCDYELIVPESDFVIEDDAITDGGDFSPKKMREASEKSHIVGDVVTDYIKYAYGKRGITFATDVETANEIAARFNSYGIPAAAVSAKTPAHTRSEYIRRFRCGQLWQLVNVDLFGEGFDVPAVEVVSLARPTASLAVYLQQCGRALRILAGKPYGLIIDHVSNYKRHGLPDKLRYWTLDRRDRRAKSAPDPEDIDLNRCVNCSKPYERAKIACPHCGHVPEPPAPGSRSIETVEGNLMLLDRATLAAMRAATELESAASMSIKVQQATGNGIIAKARANSQIERIAAQNRLKDAIALWAGYQRAKNRPDEESYKRFYLTTGVDVLTALAQSRVDMEKLATTVEGWIK